MLVDAFTDTFEDGTEVYLGAVGKLKMNSESS